MGNKLITFTEEQLLEAIKGSAGIITTISENLGCSWHVARRVINENENALQAYRNEEERILDIAESKLYEQVESGDGPMIKYILATKGKRRGYTEKSEVESTHIFQDSDIKQGIIDKLIK